MWKMLNNAAKQNDMKRADVPVLDRTTHPLGLLEKMARSHPSILTFSLATYDAEREKYGDHPPDRDFYTVPADLIYSEGCRIVRTAAKDGLDTVITSKVTTSFIDAPVCHLQLIDFETWAQKDEDPIPYVHSHLLHDSKWSRSFQETMHMSIHDFTLFKSGRSHHGYGPTLLTGEAAWRAYLASLLTLAVPNVEGLSSAIDCRWVGHCLSRGYSALRLSSVYLNYLQEPCVDRVPEDEI